MATSSRSDSDAGQIERVMKSLLFLDCAQMTANGGIKSNRSDIPSIGRRIVMAPPLAVIRRNRSTTGYNCNLFGPH